MKISLQSPLMYIDPGTGIVVTTATGWILGMLGSLLALLAGYGRRLLQFGRRHAPQIGILILLACLAGGLYLYMKHRNTATNRVIVLGIDAMDPARTDRLLAAGRLPNFARLQAQGSYSRLRTSNPAQSPVAWAAFATGRNPGQHGIFDFLKLHPASMALSVSITPADMKHNVLRSRAIWDSLQEKGIHSTWIGLPDTFPPPRIRGKLLSGMGTPDLRGTEGTYTLFSADPADAASTGGRVVQVSGRLPMIQELEGPRVQRGSHIEPARIPFELTQTQSGLQMRIGSHSYDVPLHNWSNWIPARFNTSMFGKAHAVFRTWLHSTDPLRLYISPMNIDPEKPFYPISHPRSYAKELATHVGCFHTQGMPMDTWALNNDALTDPAFLQQVQDVHAERSAIMAHVLATTDNGLHFFYFETLDIVQHMFWRNEDPLSPLHQAPVSTDVIDDWYIRIDTMVGTVMDQIAPDEKLLILSDHGFTSYHTAFHLNNWLEQEGLLAWLPGATRADLASIDRARTQAFATGFGGLYIHSASRFPDGIVADKDIEPLAQRIITAAGALQQQGKRVFSSVHAASDLYTGPYVDTGPDIVLGFAEGFRASWQTALGGAGAGLAEPNRKKWSGDHLVDPALVPGVLFSNTRLDSEDASLYDIAPTLLHWMGISGQEILEQGYEGNILQEPATDL